MHNNMGAFDHTVKCRHATGKRVVRMVVSTMLRWVRIPNSLTMLCGEARDGHESGTNLDDYSSSLSPYLHFKRSIFWCSISKVSSLREETGISCTSARSKLSRRHESLLVSRGSQVSKMQSRLNITCCSKSLCLFQRGKNMLMRFGFTLEVIFRLARDCTKNLLSTSFHFISLQWSDHLQIFRKNCEVSTYWALP